MFSSSRPLPGWNPQSANKDGEYYDKGKLTTVPGSITPPLRDNVFSAEELGISPNSVSSNNAVTQSTPVSGYVNTGDYNKDINRYLSGFADPDEEDRIRRQSRNRMAIMAVGDAIRQLGNIYHTSRYAPSQKFNNPVENEYSRYYTEKRVRDADRYKKMVRQQQRDKLEAEQRQREFQNQFKLKEHDYKLAKDKQAQENWQKTFEANQKQRDLTNELNQKKFENQKAYQEASLKLRKETADRAHARGMASLNETRRYHNYLMNKGSGGGSGSGSSDGYKYQTTNGGVISMKKNWNDTQKKQWEQWMRSKGMFTDDYEERLSEATTSERDKLISNAIAFALRNNKSAEDFAIRNFGATQVYASTPSKTTQSKSGNTQKKASSSAGAKSSVPKKAGTSVANNAQKSTTGKIKIDW